MLLFRWFSANLPILAPKNITKSNCNYSRSVFLRLLNWNWMMHIGVKGLLLIVFVFRSGTPKMTPQRTERNNIAKKMSSTVLLPFSTLNNSLIFQYWSLERGLLLSLSLSLELEKSIKRETERERQRLWYYLVKSFVPLRRVKPDVLKRTSLVHHVLPIVASVFTALKITSWVETIIFQNKSTGSALLKPSIIETKPCIVLTKKREQRAPITTCLSRLRIP